jgi:DNA adenine methylase
MTRRRVLADSGCPTVFPYFGSKLRSSAAIVKLFPDHKTFVEPFGGSAAVLLAKPRSAVEVLNDLDHLVVTFFRVLRDQPEDLARVCALTPYSMIEHGHALTNLESPVSDLERARRFWVVASQSFQSRLPTASWLAPTATRAASGKVSVLEDFSRVASRLSRVHLECTDALSLMVHLDDRRTLHYLDPPYAPSTRPWTRQSRRLDYRHEMLTDDDHREFLDAILRLKGVVVVSGRPDSLYDSELSDWTRHQLRSDFVWINR